MKTKYLPLIIAAIVVLGSAASAQDSKGLLEVLQKAQGDALNGKAKISEKKPESAKGGMGVQVKIDVMGGSGLESVFFTGEVDVHSSGGAIAAVSSGGLPQIQLYRGGSKDLVRQTYSDSPVDAEDMMDILAKSIDLKLLADEVKRAKRVRNKQVNGENQYRVTLSDKYFKKKIGGNDQMGGMAAQAAMLSEAVLEGVLVVNANADGNLKSLTLEIQYNDPMAGLFDSAMMGAGGGGAFQFQPSDMKKSDKPGRKVVVEFTVGDESKAAKAFAEEAKKLLK